MPTHYQNHGILSFLQSRVFVKGPEDLGSIPGRIIPKTLKMVLDTSLLNTQQYKVRIKGKVEQSRERSSPPLHLGVVAIEKGAFGSPSTTVVNFIYAFNVYIVIVSRVSKLKQLVYCVLISNVKCRYVNNIFASSEVRFGICSWFF